MDEQVLWRLIPVAVLSMLGAALLTGMLCLIRRRDTVALRQRMAELNPDRPELAVIDGDEARHLGAAHRRKAEHNPEKQSCAA